MDSKTIRNFKRIRLRIMRHPKFVRLSPVMWVGKRELSLAVSSACTNGRDEIYNHVFLFQWGDKEAGFIIVHENYHKAARHLEIYVALHRIDPVLANAACDYWINGKIIKADPNEEVVAMPKDENGKPIGLYDPKYDGWTVKRIFDDLRQNPRPELQPPPQSGEGGEGGDTGDKGFDEHDWEGAKSMSDEEKKELKGEIERAIREGEMAAKAMGVSQEGGDANALSLGELLKPKVDWVQQLKEFVRATCTKKDISTWRRLNRRFLHEDIAMPTMIGNSIKELVASQDVSGSMFCRSRYEKCMSEIEGIARQLKVDKLHLIYWDGKVEKHEVYTQATLSNWRNVTRPTGGGSTDPSCIPKYLKENGIKPDAVVVLTDGEVAGWGTWECPVLWAITQDGVNAPVGKTIHLGE